jgi:tryptophan synthase alpha chain
MSRLKTCFEQLQEQQRKALIPFMTAGDPNKNWTVEMMHTLVAAGADIIELGVPFSDPMADGPVIQLADERALAQGVTLKDVLAMVKQFRLQDERTPIVLMGYLNPVEIYGYEAFAQDCAEVGVDGLLIVDLPPEEAGALIAPLKAVGLDLVFLIAPTTSETRVGLIARHASGYLYVVSLKGVTGAGHLDVESVAARLETIRQITQLPLAVGFGIKDATSAAAIAGVAEGVVVGSALVEKIAAHQQDKTLLVKELADFVGVLRQAIDGALQRQGNQI